MPAWPMSQDYNEAIQNPAHCFTDPELQQAEAVTNALGLPVPCSGNFADVYAMTAGPRKWAVKCFTRQIPGLKERYVEISKYLQQVSLPFMVDFRFLEQGIRVRGQWFPILKMQWVEGLALNAFVRENLDKPQILDGLCQIWLKLAARLREANLAHCDLQHGNVLMVTGASAGKMGVRLVDYDGTCVPALELLKSIEVGHPAYQHPQRLREGLYGMEVDRFSHLVIYTSLRAIIAGGKGLWQKYDNGDNLLFRQDDFAAPRTSALFQELLKLNDPEVKKLAQAVAIAAQNPMDRVPLLEQLVEAPKPKPAPPTMTVPTVRRTGMDKPAPPTVDAPFAAVAEEPPTISPRRQTQYRRKQSSGLVFAAIAVVALLAGAAALFIGLRPKPGPKTVEVAQVSIKAESKTTKSGSSRPTSKRITAPRPKTYPDSTMVPRPDPMPKFEPKPEPKTEPKPEPTPDPKPEPDPKSEPTPEPKSIPSPRPADGKPVNLLKLIRLDKDTVQGKWAFQGDTLVSPTGGDWSDRVQIPYVPPEEYDIRLVAERKQGNDNLVVGLVLAKKQCLAMVDGWPHLGYRSGLEEVDGMRLDSNANAHKGKVFENDKPSVITYSVRRTSVTATVDGKTIFSYKSTEGYPRISLPPAWTVPDKQALFVSTWGSIYHITKMELTPISGPGKAPASEESPPIPAGPFQYLADLDATDASVGYGTLGTGSDLGYEGVNGEKKIVVKGVASEKGLSTHPPSDGSAKVVYQLGRKYREFKTTVAINDDVNVSDVPLVFTVLGDGQELWRSKPMQKSGEPQECAIPVGNVNRLELKVVCSGSYGCAHAVWLEPRLAKVVMKNPPKTIPVAPKEPTILRAFYGAHDKWYNVAPMLRTRLKKGGARFDDSYLYKGDAYPNKHKALILVYRLGSKTFLCLRGDAAQEPLTLPPTAGATNMELPNGEPGQGIIVLGAQWGADTSWVEVTAKVKALAKPASLVMSNVNDLGVPDPAVGKFKSLVVVYKFGGKIYVAIIGDGQALKVP